MKVIVHSGLVSPELAAGLAASGVDGVMLDVIGADETLRDVYHLDLTVADVDRSLRLLSEAGLRIIPHIVLGLHYGRFLGEHRALEMVTRYPVSTLILVVLVPLVGTPMAHVPPPPVDQVAEFFATARLGRSVDDDQSRLRPPVRCAARGARPGGDRPRAERHRLSGGRRNRVREVARACAAAVRVLLLAHLERGTGQRLRRRAGDQVSEAWRLLADDGAGAAEGLALDEALMSRYARDEPDCPPTLRLYSYRDHCALIGRYQNLEAEVDLAACRRTGTEVSRRLTGGGAIVMGSGQLGIAYVDRARTDQRPRETIEELSAALVAGCARLGIPASFGGKNDLEVGSRKIAGLGLYVDSAGAMLFHASVLADLDVAFMLQVLQIPAAKLADRATAGGERADHDRLGRDRRPARRRDSSTVIADGFATTFGVSLEPATPDRQEQAHAVALAASRYRSQSWLSERSVAADASGSSLLKTPAGLARIYLATHGDLVKSVMVAGDFNELPPALVAMESGLRWRRLEHDAILAVVARSQAADALGVAPERLAAAVMEAGRQAGELDAARAVRATDSCLLPEPVDAADRRCCPEPG